MIWDHNRGVMCQRAKAVLDDPAASKYVWGTGFQEKDIQFVTWMENRSLKTTSPAHSIITIDL